jgi:hypothetical protein
MNPHPPRNELSIRQIEPGDASEVSVLIEQLGYRRSAEEVAEWIGSADPRQQTAFVACCGGRIAGWIEVAMERRLV